MKFGRVEFSFCFSCRYHKNRKTTKTNSFLLFIKFSACHINIVIVFAVITHPKSKAIGYSFICIFPNHFSFYYHTNKEIKREPKPSSIAHLSFIFLLELGEIT